MDDPTVHEVVAWTPSEFRGVPRKRNQLAPEAADRGVLPSDDHHDGNMTSSPP